MDNALGGGRLANHVRDIGEVRGGVEVGRQWHHVSVHVLESLWDLCQTKQRGV